MSSADVTAPEVTLTKVVRDEPWCWGNTALFEVHVDGVWVGWVYDERELRASGVTGGRRWVGTHRQAGDTHARWSTDMLGTRKAALAALLADIAR